MSYAWSELSRRNRGLLWADCDGDDAVAALQGFEPAPAIVIASGSGLNCHAYWPLTEPLDRDEVERANRRPAHALGADPRLGGLSADPQGPRDPVVEHEPPTAVEALRLDTRQRLRPGESSRRFPTRRRRRGRRMCHRSFGGMTSCWRSRPTSTCGA